MLNIIRAFFVKSIEDIDSGNTNISEEDGEKIIEIINKLSDKTGRLSKSQACEYLNMSRSSFDNYVRDGIIPRGQKVAGFKELFWTVKSLDKIKNERNKRNNSALHGNSRRKKCDS